MLDLFAGAPFSQTSSRKPEGISFSVFTSVLDLEFSVDRIFGMLDKVLTILHWPQVKMMEEIRRGFAILYKDERKSSKESVPFALCPYFYHVYVDQKENCILIFVPRNQNLSFPVGFDKHDFDSLGLPVYSFCYCS